MVKGKIGIITFHKAVSYGAGYQAYALQQYLIKCGYKVEIIDYLPPRFRRWRTIFLQPTNTSFIKKCFKLLPYVICKTTSYHMLMRFNKLYLNLSENTFFSENELTAYNFPYKTFITGSDQVWNLKFDELKNIRPYLLSFTDEKDIRISYASSIGLDKLSNVEPIKKKEFLSFINRYNAISVREESAQKLLAQHDIVSEWVLDPTFLLNADDWLQLSKKPKKKINKKFVFVYGLYRNKQLYNLAHKIARRKKLAIVNIAESYDFCKGAINDIIVTHEELLWYITNAECVITDSFHGTALSINMNKSVYIFGAARYNTRISSLVSLLGLGNRYITKDKNVDISVIDMDYSTINEKLKHERIRAEKYLKEALSQ